MYKPAYVLPVRVQCARCSHWIDGQIEFDGRLQMIDTPGFVWAGAAHCTICYADHLDLPR